jgi:hypothetical protein
VHAVEDVLSIEQFLQAVECRSWCVIGALIRGKDSPTGALLARQVGSAIFDIVNQHSET